MDLNTASGISTLVAHLSKTPDLLTGLEDLYVAGTTTGMDGLAAILLDFTETVDSAPHRSGHAVALQYISDIEAWSRGQDDRRRKWHGYATAQITRLHRR